MTGAAALVVIVTDKPTVRGLALSAAAMELVGDKLPSIPNRTDPAPLIGRVVIGAVIGAALGDSRQGRARGAVIGAAAAFVATHATFHARRALSEILPPTAAALVEDAVMLAAAAAVVHERRGPQAS